MMTVRPIDGIDELDAVRSLCWDYRTYLLESDPVTRPAYLQAYPKDGYKDLMARLDIVHARPTGAIYGAFQAGTMVGCGMSYPIKPRVTEIKRVYVSPICRGAGTGAAIVNALIAQAKADGYHTVMLDTAKSLHAARRLYERLGFRERGPYYDVPPEAEDLLCWFEKQLTTAS